MTFFFSLLDIVLTSVLIFDTLGLVYCYRKNNTCDRKEYTRICFSWILFLTICNFFSCDKKGFIGTLGRLIIFLAKAFVTLPALGGTMKLDKYLFEDGNAERYFKKIEELVKSKICKSGKFHSS